MLNQTFTKQFNSAWKDVAVYHAAFRVKLYSYYMRMQDFPQRELISYHNGSVALIPLLESLPPDLKREIVEAKPASV